LQHSPGASHAAVALQRHKVTGFRHVQPPLPSLAQSCDIVKCKSLRDMNRAKLVLPFTMASILSFYTLHPSHNMLYVYTVAAVASAADVNNKF